MYQKYSIILFVKNNIIIKCTMSVAKIASLLTNLIASLDLNSYDKKKIKEQLTNLQAALLKTLTPDQIEKLTQIEDLLKTLEGRTINYSEINTVIGAILIAIPAILLEISTLFTFVGLTGIFATYIGGEQELLSALKTLLQTLQAIQSQGLGMA